MSSIISTAITFIVSTLLGYCLNAIKNYKKKIEKKESNEQVQNNALKIILQSQLTNVYFVYQELGEIPDYVYKNWLNMLVIYEELDGDDYIHTLAGKMKNWKIIKTDILK